MKITTEQQMFFVDVAYDIINHEEYQKLKNLKHHHYLTRYEHSLHVAYRSFRIAIKKNIVDLRSVIRGALLHDLYFYDRKVNPVKKHLKVHPNFSLENALKYFELNDIEKDIILSHMWPIGNVKPKYKSSKIVSKSDKVCSVVEVFGLKKKLRLKIMVLHQV